MASQSDNYRELHQQRRWTKRTIQMTIAAMKSIAETKHQTTKDVMEEKQSNVATSEDEAQHVTFNNINSLRTPALHTRQQINKDKGMTRKRRRFLIYTTSEDETPTLTLNHATSHPENQENYTESRVDYNLEEESEDDDETKPICYLYKKDIKGDTRFLYPPYPLSLQQGDPSTQDNTSSTNKDKNDDQSLSETDNETTYETEPHTSSSDESYKPTTRKHNRSSSNADCQSTTNPKNQSNHNTELQTPTTDLAANNESALSTPRRIYMLRPRFFRARKMKPGEDGESEKHPIVVL